MKKKRSTSAHEQSLPDQLVNPENYGVRVHPHKKTRKHGAEKPDAGTVEAGQSATILSLAREQQQDEAMASAQAATGLQSGAFRFCASSAKCQPAGCAQLHQA
jgi:hypothetical protein